MRWFACALLVCAVALAVVPATKADYMPPACQFDPTANVPCWKVVGACSDEVGLNYDGCYSGNSPCLVEVTYNLDGSHPDFVCAVDPY